jgi:homotetrameric cytidine deaminase
MSPRTDIVWEALEEAALEVQARAYCPYSEYPVGAAILGKSGRIYAGCNVENAAYGHAICAERSALVQMVASGEREPIAVLVVTSGPRPGTPCGACRQMLAEFARDLPDPVDGERRARGDAHDLAGRAAAGRVPARFSGEVRRERSRSTSGERERSQGAATSSAPASRPASRWARGRGARRPCA